MAAHAYSPSTQDAEGKKQADCKFKASLGCIMTVSKKGGIVRKEKNYSYEVEKFREWREQDGPVQVEDIVMRHQDETAQVVC